MTHSRTIGRRRLPDRRLTVGLVVLAVVGLVVAGVVTSNRSGLALAETADGSPEAAPTVACPDVAGQLPEVPEAAAAQVSRELDALQAQIAEADLRLVTSQGEGGPAFVDNAILGPLRDKRVATLERIEIAIGQHADRPSLLSLAECTLGDGTGAGQDGADAGGAADAAPGGDVDAGDASNGDASNGHSGDSGAATGGGNGDDVGDGRAGTAPTVDCPSVADQLPDVPDAALDEVLRDLDALQTQIGEANLRLVTSQGEGGPAFVDNAILGPLRDKRVATLERIEIAIGRHAERPHLQQLAECSLNP